MHSNEISLRDNESSQSFEIDLDNSYVVQFDREMSKNDRF